MMYLRMAKTMAKDGKEKNKAVFGLAKSFAKYVKEPTKDDMPTIKSE